MKRLHIHRAINHTGLSNLRRLLVIFALAFVQDSTLAVLPTVPEDVAIPLLFKAMTFDHRFVERTGDTVVITVIYQHDFRASRTAKENALRAIRDANITNIAGKIIDVKTVNLDQVVKWQDEVVALQTDAIYLTVLRGQPLSKITEFAQHQSIQTMSLWPDYVEEGIALSVTVENDRPKLYINRTSSLAEGSDFAAQLLKIARIVE